MNCKSCRRPNAQHCTYSSCAWTEVQHLAQKFKGVLLFCNGNCSGSDSPINCRDSTWNSYFWPLAGESINCPETRIEAPVESLAATSWYPARFGSITSCKFPTEVPSDSSINETLFDWRWVLSSHLTPARPLGYDPQGSLEQLLTLPYRILTIWKKESG